MIRLTKRNVNRLALIALIAAPLLYLFGTQFFYLNGVHGSLEVAGVGDYVSDVETYEAVNYFSPRTSYTAYGVTLSNYDGVLDINGEVTSVPSYGQYAIGDLFRLLRDGSKYLIDFPSIDGFSFGISGYGAQSSSFLWYYNNPSSWSGYPFLYLPTAEVSVDIDSFYMNIWNLTEIFGRGNEPTIAEFHEKFPMQRYSAGLNHLEYKVYSEWPETPTPQSNAYYLFGQFFYSDNFLTQWGDNAISNNPVGFAPIGNFYQWLDANLLHLSDSQIGLMAYGYSYYLAHVLLFDLFFYTCTFFISFLFGLFDKFGGSGL